MNGADPGVLLLVWGTRERGVGCAADLSGDGEADGADLSPLAWSRPRPDTLDARLAPPVLSYRNRALGVGQEDRMKQHAQHVAVAAAALAISAMSAVATPIVEDFEAYARGSFPDCPWLDAGLVDPTPPDPPDPSVTVEGTTNADGRPTQALALVDSIAPSQGIYALIPIGAAYTVSADVRVDRFSDNASNFTSDWPMQVGVGGLIGQTDLAFTPQVGIYASSFSQGWRLFASGAAFAFEDIDLNAPVVLGQWYHLDMTLTAATGAVHCVITEMPSGTVVADQTDVVKGWTPQDGVFDRVVAFDGELTKGTTVSNLAVIDNLTFETTPPSPPGPNGDLDGDGDVDGADLGILLLNWTG
jgi:hypothetical protein